MYVRWRRHKRADKHTGWNGRQRIWEERWLLTASVVESRRVDGKPRQRTVCYLGSIREDRIGDVRPRRWFWASVEARMEQAGIAETDRPRLLAAIDDRVLRPSAEELAIDAEEAARRLSEAAAMLGSSTVFDMARTAQEDADRLRESTGEVVPTR